MGGRWHRWTKLALPFLALPSHFQPSPLWGIFRWVMIQPTWVTIQPGARQLLPHLLLDAFPIVCLTRALPLLWAIPVRPFQRIVPCQDPCNLQRMQSLSIATEGGPHTRNSTLSPWVTSLEYTLGRTSPLGRWTDSVGGWQQLFRTLDEAQFWLNHELVARGYAEGPVHHHIV